jgi:hypothetical protein
MLDYRGMLPMRAGALLAACALGAGLAAISQAVEPATVTVRFIDARNGKPYTLWKGPFQISLYKADPTKGFNSRAELDANDLGIVRQVPDANGEVRFTLPNPMPGVIRLDSAFRIGCAYFFFNAREVVERGVVGENKCRTKLRKVNVKFTAKPGELVYFVAPLSFWERHPIIR